MTTIRTRPCTYVYSACRVQVSRAELVICDSLLSHGKEEQDFNSIYVVFGLDSVQSV